MWLIHYFTGQYCLHTHRPACRARYWVLDGSQPCLGLTRRSSDAFRSGSYLSGQMWVKSDCMAKRLFPTCSQRPDNATLAACYSVIPTEHLHLASSQPSLSV